MQKVSFAVKIPKNWFSEPDTEPKIGSETGSTEPVSRYVLTLLKFRRLFKRAAKRASVLSHFVTDDGGYVSERASSKLS